MLEIYRVVHKDWYVIDVSVRCSADGTFSSHGCIRHAIKHPAALNDLPFECPFYTEGHQSPQSARESGITFAKAKIDSLFQPIAA